MTLRCIVVAAHLSVATMSNEYVVTEERRYGIFVAAHLSVATIFSEYVATEERRYGILS